jgi:MoaA/NifB/PqqE/SkfB family radical SAM enzyme
MKTPSIDSAKGGVARMAISLDGPDAASHDGFRKVEGSFAWTVFGLGYARKVGLPTQINTTVTLHNIHRLNENWQTR